VVEFDRGKLRSVLQQLAEWKQTAFALSICERLLPNYVVFSRETSWGRPETIKECLSTAWRRLSDGVAQIRLTEAAEACEAAAPDTENFESKYTSAALDAALSVANLMHILNKFETAKVLEVAEAAYDTVELFVSQTDTASVVTAEDKKRVLGHPLVQSELRHQREHLELLSSLDGEFSAHESLFRNRWKNQKELSLEDLNTGFKENDGRVR
jgi:hypothetical protein